MASRVRSPSAYSRRFASVCWSKEHEFSYDVEAAILRKSQTPRRQIPKNSQLSRAESPIPIWIGRHPLAFGLLGFVICSLRRSVNGFWTLCAAQVFSQRHDCTLGAFCRV